MRAAAAWALEHVAGLLFWLGGGHIRSSRLAYLGYELAGWVDGWKRG